MSHRDKRSLPKASSQPPTANTPIVDAAAPYNTMLLSAQIAHQSGPLPSPVVLRDYEAVLPGLADRIVRMAEDETAHRRKTEADAIAIQDRDQRAYRRVELSGQICGLLIGFAALGAATYAGVHGAQITGSLIGVGGLTGLVTAFILGRSQMEKQRGKDFERQVALIDRQQNQMKHSTSEIVAQK